MNDNLFTLHAAKRNISLIQYIFLFLSHVILAKHKWYLTLEYVGYIFFSNI